ncbi:MAG: sigma-70 family RNA polymerase sigma factor [Oscillospiraceae bacterium]|nr:sigma-70 family RNA polymerase sigma factor [Oscillospiraceae bacterium]
MYDVAFNEAVRDYRSMVFRIAFGYCKDVHDADDITQDVFLKLYKSDEHFAAPENIKAWLIRVTMNSSKSLLRSVWQSRRSDFNEATAAQALPEDCLELYQYIDGLKPKYRTVIYLFYYEGYSVKEIAAMLSIRETTVTTQLGRARSQLKEVLLAEGFG